MGKEIVKTTIAAGDLIQVKAKIYRCETRTQSDCSAQCDLYDSEKERCTGTCYRYQREDIVFKFKCYEDEYLGRYTVVRTPCQERYDEEILLRDKARSIESSKKFRNSKKNEE